MLAYLLAAWLNRVIVEEFEIKQYESISRETRMDLPAVSFEQELISQPIPFSNRVESLVDYITLHPQVAFLINIADRFKRNSKSVAQDALSMGAQVLGTDAYGHPVFERFTAEVLEDEYLWRSKLREADQYLTANAIGKLLGRKWDWVVRNTAALNIHPSLMELRGQQELMFPASVANDLRKLELQIPPAHHHYSISELQELSGKDHRWIEKVFASHGIEAEFRANLKTRAYARHYRRDSYYVIEEALAALPAPAGDSVTISEISQKHNLSRYGVEKIIINEGIVGQEKLDTQSVPRYMYAPEEESTIVGTSTDRPEGKHYSFRELASKVNRSFYWVKDAAKPFTEEVVRGERRSVLLNEDQAAYIVEVAKAEPPLAQGWLTLEDVSHMLMKHRSWVERRIQQVAVRSEVRLDVRYKPRIHYEPDTIDELQLFYLIDEENRLN